MLRRCPWHCSKSCQALCTTLMLYRLHGALFVCYAHLACRCLCTTSRDPSLGSPIDHSMDDDTIYIDLLFMYVNLLLFCACDCACACLRTATAVSLIYINIWRGEKLLCQNSVKGPPEPNHRRGPNHCLDFGDHPRRVHPPVATAAHSRAPAACKAWPSQRSTSDWPRSSSSASSRCWCGCGCGRRCRCWSRHKHGHRQRYTASSGWYV